MLASLVCWNCENKINPGVFLCEKCNKIQPPQDIDEFQLLGINREFDINLEELENSYLRLQQLFHPDKYIELSEKEIKYSTLLSSMINDAYQKLNNSVSRATLLLNLFGFTLPSEKTSYNDSEVLEEVMEIQNKFFDAENSESKNVILENLNSRIDKTKNDISKSFKSKNYEVAHKLNIKLSYLEKIKTDFKKHL